MYGSFRDSRGRVRDREWEKTGLGVGLQQDQKRNTRWLVVVGAVGVCALLMLASVLVGNRASSVEGRPIQVSDLNVNGGRGAGLGQLAADVPVVEGGGGGEGGARSDDPSSRDNVYKESAEGKGTEDEEARSGQSPPHIVYILVDDMGWGDIGYQSNDLAGLTPVMDRLAEEGVKLNHFYSMHLCTPSRAALMSGKYPSNVGMNFDVIHADSPWGLPLDQPLLPEILRGQQRGEGAGGYTSHAVGKWHIGHSDPLYMPQNRGFTTFLGYMQGEMDYWSHRLPDLYAGDYFFDFVKADSEGYSPAWGDYANQYTTEIFTDRAVELIEAHEEEEDPLFLYLAYQAVHYPTNPPADSMLSAEQLELVNSMENPERRMFAKVLTYLDSSIGRVVDSLEAQGMLDNSVIVLTSDNGGCPRYGASNFPLRGLKHFMFEGGVRVPGFVHSALLPSAARGQTYEGLFHMVDMVPTLASAAGVDLSAVLGEEGLAELDGVDQWPSLMAEGQGQGQGQGQSSSYPRSEVLIHYDPYEASPQGIDSSFAPRAAIISSGWKLILNEYCNAYHSYNKEVADPALNVCPADTPACSSCSGICTSEGGIGGGQDGNDHDDDEKEEANQTGGEARDEKDDPSELLTGRSSYLFHLDEDPYETTNLFEALPDKVKDMSRLLEQAVQRAVASVWVEDNVDAAVGVWKASSMTVLPWEGL